MTKILPFLTARYTILCTRTRCLRFSNTGFSSLNKSTAGMHHTPPRNIFDTKIIHKSRAITQMKNFKRQSRAITLYLFVKIYPSAIPEHSFTIMTLISSLKKIGKGMPKIESENQFLKSIKGRHSVLICQNLPICNPRTLLLPNINSHSKFEENWFKNAPSRE